MNCFQKLLYHLMVKVFAKSTILVSTGCRYNVIEGMKIITVQNGSDNMIQGV